VQPIPPALSTSSRNKEGDILTMVLPRIKWKTVAVIGWYCNDNWLASSVG
jgi:hypothetical protein